MPNGQPSFDISVQSDGSVSVAFPPGPMPGPMVLGVTSQLGFSLEVSGAITVTFPNPSRPTISLEGTESLPPVSIVFPSGGTVKIPLPAFPLPAIPSDRPPVAIGFEPAAGFGITFPQ